MSYDFFIVVLSHIILLRWKKLPCFHLTLKLSCSPNGLMNSQFPSFNFHEVLLGNQNESCLHKIHIFWENPNVLKQSSNILGRLFHTFVTLSEYFETIWFVEKVWKSVKACDEQLAAQMSYCCFIVVVSHIILLR